MKSIMKCLLLLPAVVLAQPGPLVCYEDECSSSKDGANLCVGNTTSLTYFCVCGAQGWTDSQDGQSCTPPPPTPPNPSCNSDECSSAVAPGNICIKNDGDGTYSCSCQEPGWVASWGGKFCIPPIARCLLDDCFSSIDPLNVCIDKKDGTYICECNAAGWSAPSGAQTCQRGLLEPCMSDECSSSESRDNVCILDDSNPNGYACSCNGAGWGTSDDLLSCIPPFKYCERDECSSAANAQNVCKDAGNGIYTCVCGGAGWNVSRDGKACSPPAQKCLLNECSQDSNLANSCTDLGDGTYKCDCQANGWNDSPDGQSCTPPPQACNSDECSSAKAPGNICIPNVDGSYSCSCGEPGWIGSPNEQFCLHFDMTGQNCLLDECYSSADPLNVCVDNNDGTYICECNAAGWSVAADMQECRPPKARCTSAEGDVCSSVASSENSCRDNLDGTYTCICEGAGWQSGPAQQSCTPPPLRCPPFEEDVCLQGATRSSSPNLCVDHGDGSFHCECSEGWVPGDNSLDQNATYCVTPPVRCLQDECATSQNPANLCSDLHNGLFSCACASGWVSADNQQACYPPQQQCNSDECNSGSDPLNICEDNLDGTFSCSCNNLKWWQAFDGDNYPTCIPKLCLQDECSSLEGPNVCTDHKDGSYSCSCKGREWVSDKEELQCLSLKSALVFDGTPLPLSSLVPSAMVTITTARPVSQFKDPVLLATLVSPDPDFPAISIVVTNVTQPPPFSSVRVEVSGWLDALELFSLDKDPVNLEELFLNGFVVELSMTKNLLDDDLNPFISKIPLSVSLDVFPPMAEIYAPVSFSSFSSTLKPSVPPAGLFSATRPYVPRSAAAISDTTTHFFVNVFELRLEIMFSEDIQANDISWESVQAETINVGDFGLEELTRYLDLKQTISSRAWEARIDGVDGEIVHIRVKENTIRDIAGNLNLPSSKVLVHFDMTPPSVSISSSSPVQANLPNSLHFYFQFSEMVTLIERGRGIHISVSLPDQPQHSMRVSLADAVAANQTVPWTAELGDQTTVQVFLPQSTNSVRSMTGAFDFAFSDLWMVQIELVPPPIVSNTSRWKPPRVMCAAWVDAGAAVDRAGNHNIGEASAGDAVSVIIDAAAPVIIVDVADLAHNSRFTSLSELSVTLTISKAVAGFSAESLNSSLPLLNVEASKEDQLEWRFQVQGSEGQRFVLRLNDAQSITDAGGKVLLLESGYASSQALLDITFDQTPPSLIVSSSSPPLGRSRNLHILFSFSESISSFTPNMVLLSGSALPHLVSLSAVENRFHINSIFEAEVTTEADGEVVISVNDTMIHDRAGNRLTVQSRESITLTRLVDSVPPNVFFSLPSARPPVFELGGEQLVDSSSAFPSRNSVFGGFIPAGRPVFHVSISEPVLNFTANKLQVVISASSDRPNVSSDPIFAPISSLVRDLDEEANTGRLTYRISSDTIVSEGSSVALGLIDKSIVDPAGNYAQLPSRMTNSDFLLSPIYSVDSVAPLPRISARNANVSDPGHILFVVDFPEPVRSPQQLGDLMPAVLSSPLEITGTFSPTASLDVKWSTEDLGRRWIIEVRGARTKEVVTGVLPEGAAVDQAGLKSKPVTFNYAVVDMKVPVASLSSSEESITSTLSKDISLSFDEKIDKTMLTNNWDTFLLTEVYIVNTNGGKECYGTEAVVATPKCILPRPGWPLQLGPTERSNLIQSSEGHFDFTLVYGNAVKQFKQSAIPGANLLASTTLLANATRDIDGNPSPKSNTLHHLIDFSPPTTRIQIQNVSTVLTPATSAVEGGLQLSVERIFDVRIEFSEPVSPPATPLSFEYSLFLSEEGKLSLALADSSFAAATTVPNAVSIESGFPLADPSDSSVWHCRLSLVGAFALSSAADSLSLKLLPGAAKDLAGLGSLESPAVSGKFAKKLSAPTLRISLKELGGRDVPCCLSRILVTAHGPLHLLIASEQILPPSAFSVHGTDPSGNELPVLPTVESVFRITLQEARRAELGMLHDDASAAWMVTIDSGPPPPRDSLLTLQLRPGWLMSPEGFANELTPFPAQQIALDFAAPRVSLSSPFESPVSSLSIPLEFFFSEDVSPHGPLSDSVVAVAKLEKADGSTVLVDTALSKFQVETSRYWTALLTLQVTAEVTMEVIQNVPFISISVGAKAGLAKDAAGLLSPENLSLLELQVDISPPVAAMTASPVPGQISSREVLIIFSEAVERLDLSMLQLVLPPNDGSFDKEPFVGSLFEGERGLRYRVRVEGLTEQVNGVGLLLPRNSVQDLAGNGNVKESRILLLHKTHSPPSVTIGSTTQNLLEAPALLAFFFTWNRRVNIEDQLVLPGWVPPVSFDSFDIRDVTVTTSSGEEIPPSSWEWKTRTPLPIRAMQTEEPNMTLSSVPTVEEFDELVAFYYVTSKVTTQDLENGASPLETLSVVVKAGAVRDEFERQSERKVLSFSFLRERISQVQSEVKTTVLDTAQQCGSLFCYHGRCIVDSQTPLSFEGLSKGLVPTENLTITYSCECRQDWEHENDYFHVADCSVPIYIRRVAMVASSCTFSLLGLYAFYLLLLLSSNSTGISSFSGRIIQSPFQARQRFMLVCLFVWGIARGVFFALRYDTTRVWSVEDGLLLAIPIFFHFLAIALSLYVYLGYMAVGGRLQAIKSTNLNPKHFPPAYACPPLGLVTAALLCVSVLITSIVCFPPEDLLAFMEVGGNERLRLLNIGTLVLTLSLELLFAVSMASNCSGQYRFDADLLLKRYKGARTVPRVGPATPTSSNSLSFSGINTPSRKRLPRFVPDYTTGVDIVVQEYEFIRQHRRLHPPSRSPSRSDGSNVSGVQSKPDSKSSEISVFHKIVNFSHPLQKLAVLAVIYAIIPTLALVSNMTWVTFLILRWLEVPLVLVTFSLHNLEMSWVGKAAWCGDLGPKAHDPSQREIENTKRKHEFEMAGSSASFMANKRLELSFESSISVDSSSSSDSAQDSSEEPSDVHVSDNRSTVRFQSRKVSRRRKGYNALESVHADDDTSSSGQYKV